MSQNDPELGVPYPSRMRLLLFLSLLVNLVLVIIRLAYLIHSIDPHHQYRSGMYHFPGTSFIFADVLMYGMPIAVLAILSFSLWRGNERTAAGIYLLCAFVAMPVIAARYLGLAAAGYQISGRLHVILAVWFLVCCVISAIFLWKVKRFDDDRRSAFRWAMSQSD